jgi:hypothetical protein
MPALKALIAQRTVSMIPVLGTNQSLEVLGPFPQ